MAGTTTNGLPYPESTDFVTDGAQAIEDLAVDVDAKTGLWLIETKSFANVLTVQFDNCFSNKFDNYKVVVSITASTSTNTAFDMRYGNGSTFSNTGYANMVWGVFNGGTTTARNSNYTDSAAFLLALGGDKPPYTCTFDLCNPYLAQRTTWNGSGFGGYLFSGTQTRISYMGAGSHDSATSYASLLFLTSSNQNISGIISIYGYRD